MMENNSLSIAVTESLITVGEITASNGSYNCVRSQIYAINNWASTNSLIEQWAKAVLDFVGNALHPLVTLHIAMPGPFDYLEGISHIQDNRNLKSLYSKNIKLLMAKCLGIAENQINFYNDAVCSLAAELSISSQLKGKVLALYFDEGFGGAWCQNGKIEDAGLWNKPFLNGKAEDYFSVKWLRKAYFEMTGLNIMSISDVNDFSSVTGKELLKAFIENLALYIKDLPRQQSLQTIVLGGAILDSSVNVLAPLKRRLSTLGVNVQILRSKLGNMASLLGTGVLRDEMIIVA